MEKVEWKVEGMDCTNCALTISRYLQQQGMESVKVNFIGGEVSFDLVGGKTREQLARGIADLGYQVLQGQVPVTNKRKPLFAGHLQRFLFCLPFTAILMLHMLPRHPHFLMNPWIQLALCLPVFGVGMQYFGLSALKSLRRGVPNMNVLIALGATAAFVYSLIGTLQGLGMDYIFYETTATIITLVFLGEWVEHRSVMVTQRELNKLSADQEVMANMIAFDDQHQEQVFPVEAAQLRAGDLVLIRTGEQVPADCRILWGEAKVDESLLTGESRPVSRQKKDNLTGGSLLLDGSVKAQVTAAGKDTVLSNIISLVKQAQAEKPPVQQLADRISAVFVPVVVGIALLTFGINFWMLHNSPQTALMRAIAVLVISCPCAMGLATPAAIAVGLGRAARNGILFRNARSLELFKDIRIVVFDKTGTLTYGTLRITGYASSIPEAEFRDIVFSLEKYSGHPVAKAIQAAWKSTAPLRFTAVQEIKGLGIQATDAASNQYALGSYKMAAGLTTDDRHTAYLLKNGELAGWIDLGDEVRPESGAIVRYLQQRGIRTVLLSGDSQSRTQEVAASLGITEVFAEKSPDEKLQIIDSLNREAPVAMVGDGINDAPAMARATIGISLSDATQLAMQTAQVVLMNRGVHQLPLALGLGRHTYLTIRQNLFWAFIYNVVAIPVAAAGFLKPGLAALAMGFSDVVLAINSVRLHYKKVD